MTSFKRLIINCGASQVTAAVIASSGEELEIEKLVTEELDYDFSQDDAAMKAIGKALKRLARFHKFSGSATLILPGNQTLTKTIRIPYVEEAKRAQVIAFEAQQNIPYPLHEVVWDSQVVGDDGVETEVLFIAAKSSAVDDFYGQMSAAGFSVANISAATVLDYNSLQFAYPDVDEDVLLINVGSRSTNLLFRNPSGFFVRNIQLGGNSLTQSLADSLGKSFLQAEAFKHACFRGEVDSAASKAVTDSSESFMRRMSQEITRSIVNYRRQYGGAAPTRILLNGRGALLTGLAEYLTATQKVSVEYFDPLQRVTLNSSINIDTDVLRLQVSEIIGEACRDMIPDAAGVNLLPEGVQKANEFASKKPMLLVAVACLALAPLPVFLSFQQANAACSAELRTIREAIVPLQSNQAAIRENREQAELAAQSIQLVEGLVNSKANWIQFFAELQKSLHDAKDVWLDQLKVVRDTPEGGAPSYEVLVEGQMLVREASNSSSGIDQEALFDRIKGLQSSFENSEFVVFSKSPVITWTSLRDGLNVLPFSINLVVDTAKPL
jgi:type IV pilus assembly protein PilM